MRKPSVGPKRRNLSKAGKFPPEVQEVFHQFLDLAMLDASTGRKSSLAMFKLEPTSESAQGQVEYWDHAMRCIKWLKHRVGHKQAFIPIEAGSNGQPE